MLNHTPALLMAALIAALLPLLTGIVPAGAQPNRPPPKPPTTPLGRWEVFAGGRDAPGELIRPSGVAIDAAGTLFVGDPANNRVQTFRRDGTPAGSFPIWPGWVGRISPIQEMSLTPNGEMVVLFAQAMQFAGPEPYFALRYGADGHLLGQFGPVGERPSGLARPTGLDVGPDGTAWIVEDQRNRLTQYARDGRWLREIATEPGSEPGQLRNPVGVAVAPDGTLWVTDAGNNRVQRLGLDGAPLAVWDKAGTEWGEFNGVRRIRVGRDGAVVVSESGSSYSSTRPQPNHRIQKLRPDGTPLASAWVYDTLSLAVAPDGSVVIASEVIPRGVHLFSPALDPLGPFGMAPPPETPGRLVEPHAIATRPDSAVYIADGRRAAIFVFGPDGTLVDQWGTRGDALGELREPSGLVVTRDGTIYVSDQALDRIYKLAPDWQLLDTWGGSGRGPGRFRSPHGLALDRQENLYVADADNGRVQKLSPNGDVLASWSGGGRNAATSFARPDGIAVDSQGRIYVSDSTTSMVYRLHPDGTMDRVLASFSTPLHSVAVDADDRVWVTEYRGGRLWQLNQDGAFIAGWGNLDPADPLLGSPTGLFVEPGGRLYVTSDEQARVWRFTPEAQP